MRRVFSSFRRVAVGVALTAPVMGWLHVASEKSQPPISSSPPSSPPPPSTPPPSSLPSPSSPPSSCSHLLPSSDFHHAARRLIDEHSLPNWRFFRGFVASINFALRIPNVVIERFPEHFSTAGPVTADRQHSQFSGTIDCVPEEFRAGLLDYRGSGYTRGHMASAGNFVNSTQETMDETFLLSANVVPQEGVNNGDAWFRLEYLTRQIAPLVGKDAFILSGPLFLPHTVPESEDPDANISRYRRKGDKKYVTYEVLGERNVAVPTHLYKILVSIREDGTAATAAFIVENRANKKGVTIEDLLVPLARVEGHTGFKVLASVPKTELCGTKQNQIDCEKYFLSESAYETVMLNRRLRWAKSLNELDKEWNSAQKKGVEIDENARNFYTTRREALVTRQQERKAAAAQEEEKN